MFVCALRHDARCFLSILRSISLSLIVFVTNSTNERNFQQIQRMSGFFYTVTFFQRWLFLKDDLGKRDVAYYYEAFQENYCENGFEITTTKKIFDDLCNLLI